MVKLSLAGGILGFLVQQLFDAFMFSLPGILMLAFIAIIKRQSNNNSPMLLAKWGMPSWISVQGSGE
jgi:hypothetical protein